MAQVVERISDAISGQKTRAFLSDGIDDVVFDVIITENDSDSLNVTRHAVEDGSDVTDHVNSTPRKFSIDAILTDADLDVLNPVSFLNKTIDERLDVIDKWIKKKKVLTYYGHDKDIEDVIVQSISRKRSQSTGDGLEVSLSIDKINIVSSVQQNIDIKTTVPKGKTATQTQTTPGSTSSAALKNKSWAKSLFS